MKRTLIIALAVLVLSIGVCVASTAAVDSAVTQANALRRQAVHAAQLGNVDGARELAAQLYGFWQSRSRVLEMLTSHDALSEAEGGIADAMICLDNGDADEFQRALSTVGTALERIRITEAARFMNLF